MSHLVQSSSVIHLEGGPLSPMRSPLGLVLFSASLQIPSLWRIYFTQMVKGLGSRGFEFAGMFLFLFLFCPFHFWALSQLWALVLSLYSSLSFVDSCFFFNKVVSLLRKNHQIIIYFQKMNSFLNFKFIYFFIIYSNIVIWKVKLFRV